MVRGGGGSDFTYRPDGSTPGGVTVGYVVVIIEIINKTSSNKHTVFAKVDHLYESKKTSQKVHPPSFLPVGMSRVSTAGKG